MKTNNTKSKRKLDGLDVSMAFLGGLVLGTFFGIIATVAIYL